MQYVIHPKPDGKTAIIIPSGIIPVQDVALKDVPPGVPFRIVGPSELPPADAVDSWVADFSSPHGHGIGHEEWTRLKDATAQP